MTFPKDRVDNLLARRGIEFGDILRVVEVGSTAHGISTPDTGDDYDYTVVRMEPWDEFVTGPNDRQSMMIRTQPDGVRSRMGDIDLNVYTLRKFASLAAGGNPSILGAIFSQLVHYRSGGIKFATLGEIVASKKAGNAFLGYMRQQIDRWIGIRGQKSVSRPELVDAYGFDTKYAAHTVRLGIQGIEYMYSGRYSMPMAAHDQMDIVALRTGGFDERQALTWARELEADLVQAVAESPLPEKPGNWQGWVTEQYGQWWL